MFFQFVLESFRQAVYIAIVVFVALVQVELLNEALAATDSVWLEIMYSMQTFIVMYSVGYLHAVRTDNRSPAGAAPPPVIEEKVSVNVLSDDDKQEAIRQQLEALIKKGS